MQPWSCSRPCGNLKSPEVCKVLQQHIVLPFLQPQYTVTALRMSWFNRSVDYLNQVTEQLVHLRAQLDEYVNGLPGVQLVISAVTATRSSTKKVQDMKLYPGVAYWVVLDAASFDQRALCSFLQTTDSKPTLKLLLQPYQQTEKDITTALSSVLKDSMEGVVRKLLDYSANTQFGSAAGTYPIVRVFNHNSKLNEMIGVAKAKLDKLGLFFDLA